MLTPVGHVQVRNNSYSSWLNAEAGSPLYDRSVLYTDKDSQASFLIRDTRIELEEKSLVQVIDPQNQPEFQIDFGALRLNSSRQQTVILSMNGEKVHVHLNNSEIKIRRDRKTGTTRIESLRGPVKIDTNGREKKIETGDSLDLTQSVAQLNPPATPPPPDILRLAFQSGYAQDDQFTRRPTLQFVVLSDVHDVRFEIQQNGNWTTLAQNTFTPDEPGTYLVRGVGRDHNGQELTAPPSPWSPRQEHFERRQPKLKNSSWQIDPTKKMTDVVFTDAKTNEPEVAELKTAQGFIKTFTGNPRIHLANLPMGSSQIRLKSSGSLNFEQRWQSLSIGTPAPRVRWEDDHLSIPPLLSPQFKYAVQLNQRTALMTMTGQEANPPEECLRVGCRLIFYYQNVNTQKWLSKGTTVVIARKEEPRSLDLAPRQLAAESSGPNPNENLRQKFVQPTSVERAKGDWTGEVGVGGNYLMMQSSSGVTNGNISGMSGPTLFLDAEKRYPDFGFKASLLDVHSKISLTDNGQSNQHDLNWISGWGGITTRGWWILHQLEFGLGYNQIPLVYQGATTSQFVYARSETVTAGFSSKYDIGAKDFVLWNQRLHLPLATSAESPIESFKLNLEIEGSLSYYRCLNGGLALGLSWLGQMSQMQFHVPASRFLQADSPTERTLNSNLQFRMLYGICRSSRND